MQSIISGASNVMITGGNFTNNGPGNARKSQGMDLLTKSIAPGGFHNSGERFDPPKCHPETRVAILKEIMSWVEKFEKTCSFLWLQGPAGAGKSAIAQSIAELCFTANLLAASFFFSRTAAGRNDTKCLVPTLVYQLCLSIPEIRSRVEEIIDRDPMVLSRSVDAQFQALIIDPLLHTMTPRFSPRFIIIDGLDECGDQSVQGKLLEVLATTVAELPIPLFFLIASRPEQQIRQAFDTPPLSETTERLALDDTYLPGKDIRFFLGEKFKAIRQTHPTHAHLLPSWPSTSDIASLVQKSSGQFIYASTIIKYVASPRHRPTDRLKIILGIKPPPKNDTPFAELDALYHFIFSCVENLETALDILSVILFTVKGKVKRTPRLVEDLLFLQHGDVAMELCDLHSILDVPTPPDGIDGGREIRILHASLSDFLFNESRSGFFSINPEKACTKLTRCFLKHTRCMGVRRRSIQNPRIQVLGQNLMALCVKAQVTPELLQDLEAFDVFAFLDHVWIQGAATRESIYSDMPAFFKWCQAQTSPQLSKSLYSRNLSSWDRHLKDILQPYSKSEHFMPFLMLPVPPHSMTPLFSVTSEPPGTHALDYRSQIPQHNKKNLAKFHSSLATFFSETFLTEACRNFYGPYQSLIIQFLKDPARAGEFLVDDKKNILLAKKLTEYLTCVSPTTLRRCTVFQTSGYID
ncbi:hypothetical protein B0H34DRAFT_723341 [Crassisporium funariophilum]|nr:hypothetical protein B0H34DRAFT_723341 [Crassisporium funariophilum]